ncbi:MAG: hypothetical protein KAR39_03995 [Thermoplasmata archaeon]|nr:hypothetical protein [Thermoplasmata archaeon]
MIQTLMQYEEAVGAYCLACQETNVADFTNRILKYRTKQVHDFYSRIDSLTEDELSNTLSFCSPSFWTPVPDSRTIKKKMKKSRELLREKLNRLREFWEEYHDFYNASKHGGRYWLSELRLKEKQEQYLGIQWLKRDKGIDTRLAEGDEIETQTAHLADTARSIMTVLHANRILVWSSVGKVDPTMYRYL